MDREHPAPDIVVAEHAAVMRHPEPEVQQALWECLVALRPRDFVSKCDESELEKLLYAACDRFDGEGRNQMLTRQEVECAGLAQVHAAHSYLCDLSEYERESVLSALATKLREFGQRWRVRSPSLLK